MARLQSRAKAGFLPIEERHFEAIFSLIEPVNSRALFLDPFAGEGDFAKAAEAAWNVTAYTNELDGNRADKCIQKFGLGRAVHGDVERLTASSGAFSIGWYNPPYDHDKTAQRGSQRVEYRYLRHAWKWIVDGGLVMWVVYRSHITDDAATFFSRWAVDADVWALPGKHQGKYDQMIVIARKGRNPNPDPLFEKIIVERDGPRILVPHDEPLYSIPPATHVERFVFSPNEVDEKRGKMLIEHRGAWQSAAFQTFIQPEPAQQDDQPVVQPRPGHMAFVLAGISFQGIVLDSDQWGGGKVALKSRVHHVEEQSDWKADDESSSRTMTVRLKPRVIMHVAGADGSTAVLEGDDAILDFIQSHRRPLVDYLNRRFTPLYAFDFAGVKPFLDGVRLNGKYPIYTAQKHVIGAVMKGLQRRKGMLLVGQMGVGKTLMGSAVATMIGARSEDGVVLVVCPPHLVKKWRREIESVHPRAVVRNIHRHEDVKRFMALPKRDGIPKIGIIKRDMTKLGSRRETAVVWRNRPYALWRKDQQPPDTLKGYDRIQRERIPLCPVCGNPVYMSDDKDNPQYATETWLKSGKRECATCFTPLWQQGRSKAESPKADEKFPPKNPRYRLDEYIHRFYQDRIALLIWDEVHEAAHGDTGNGEAFGRLANASDKVLAMTGTPFNGRSSSMFNIEYAINPRVRQRYAIGGSKRLSRRQSGSQYVIHNGGNRGASEGRWVADMGVREKTITEYETYNRQTGVMTGTSTYERPYVEGPGISPLLVAEVLDHTVFFSLADLGKALPDYQEVAHPVTMDADMLARYRSYDDKLMGYMKGRRQEGDSNTFRGAYLQWAMGWINAPWRPYNVIHKRKNPHTGRKQPYEVLSIPAQSEDRVFAKENELIDLVQRELADGRPVVVYARQTGKRDIQPRLHYFMKRIAGAQPFTLRANVSPDRREAVIQKQIDFGTDGLICNPELVKTGLDLLHFPTLIFFEPVYNLSTMMQAAARAFRLNQTHGECKVVYLFYEGTIEQTAIHLMSRKQRAAKLLTGDIGLTGLEAVTEGDEGFEAALLDAIGKDGKLVDPSRLFVEDRQGVTEMDAADAAFWGVGSDGNEPECDCDIVEVEPPSKVVTLQPRRKIVHVDDDGTITEQLAMF